MFGLNYNPNIQSNIPETSPSPVNPTVELWISKSIYTIIFNLMQLNYIFEKMMHRRDEMGLPQSTID